MTVWWPAPFQLLLFELMREDRVNVGIGRIGDEIAAVLLGLDQFLIDLGAGLGLGKCVCRGDGCKEDDGDGESFHGSLLWD